MENVRNDTRPMTRKISLIIIVAILIIIVSLRFKSSPENKNKPNILLVVLDTLRADHLGCYGYERDTSPYIDKLAEEGILFSNTFSQGAYTHVSIPSIFTSKLPFLADNVQDRSKIKISWLS